MINPIIVTLYGPLAIHAYGVCIAIGVVIAIYLMARDIKLQALVSFDQLINCFQFMIIAGYLGGRLGFLLFESCAWSDYLMLLQFWLPGLSILGSIIGVVVGLVWYLQLKKIALLPFLDRLSIYAPLAQSFGRLGCFFAGCCYGMQTDAYWSVVYTHFDHMAPLHIGLHPTQLYSSAILLFIFLLLYFVLQFRIKVSGVLFFVYLSLVCIERFVVDFFRWDRVYFDSVVFNFLSVYQWIALALAFFAIAGIFCLCKKRKVYGSF